MDKVTVRVRLR